MRSSILAYHAVAVPYLLCKRRSRRRWEAVTHQIAAFVLLGLFSAATVLVAQSSSSNDLTEYTQAVAHVQTNDRLTLLGRFAANTHSSPLKVDALELIIWENLRVRDSAQALKWANELATTDKDNAFALALLSDNARNQPQAANAKPGALFTMASRGLGTLPQLRRPLGMSVGDFAELTRDASIMLNGAAGWAEVQRKNYLSARVYLHNALALDPNNAQDVYALALADLEGPKANSKEGYWYLAKAVNLSQGTPQGAQIAQFARNRYVKDGGTQTDWNQFLASAAPSGGSSGPVMASATPPPGARPPIASQPASTTVPPSSASLASGSRTASTKAIYADDTPPTYPIARRHYVSTNGPMSLGILIETSLTDKANRAALVNGLSDMLRHMSDDDEAFILTYDNNLVFEQDLTSDPHQLEQAMEGIKPQKGAVLDDAIAFAAGHLARIAKYPNRVLLVISDGRNIDSHASPLRTSAEINAAGVRIDCIGFQVSADDGRYRLQALSSSTGGHSSFISDPDQFRDATKEMARNMGIDFRF